MIRKCLNGEMLLTILSSLAQEEVESLSSNVKMGLQMKMKRGELVGFNGCFGYDYHQDTKMITVNETEDFIAEANIKDGTFDNVKACQYIIPSYLDIGKVYKRLIKMVSKKGNVNVIDALIKVYNSFISEKIDDYNSSLYYENPSYIFTCYEENKMI